jgi:sulfur-oxidizing protein SoxY
MRSSDVQRRQLLLQSGWAAALAAAGLMCTRRAVAAEPASLTPSAFLAHSLEAVLHDLGALSFDAAQIELTVPALADNGAVVPVSVSSAHAGPQEIFVIVDTNPQPLVMQFKFPADTEPFVATRIKVAASGRIYAVVKTEGRLVATFKETKVLLSGCA